MKQQSPWERMKALALWKWGLICVFSGLVVGGLAQIQGPPVRNRAEALGRGLATLSFVVLGVVLVVVDLIRRAGRR